MDREICTYAMENIEKVAIGANFVMVLTKQRGRQTKNATPVIMTTLTHFGAFCEAAGVGAGVGAGAGRVLGGGRADPIALGDIALGGAALQGGAPPPQAAVAAADGAMRKADADADAAAGGTDKFG